MKVLIPTVVVFVGFFLLCVSLVVRGQKRPPVTGKAAMSGERGRVLVAVGGGDAKGKVVFHGEIWDAIADEPIAKDAKIKVIAVKGRVARVSESQEIESK